MPLDREDTFAVHVLKGVGGCFLYVTRRGEMLGLYYGATEEAAAREGALAISASAGTHNDG